MTLQHNIYAAIASLGLLASCSSDIFAPAYTVGEADNAIVLHAGISEGGAGVMTRSGMATNAGGVATRAPYNPEANHAKHVCFSEGTKLALKVDGIWLDKGLTNNLVSQKTTATIGGLVAETDGKHREVTFTSAEQLYWDDYGTADPANMSLIEDEVEQHVDNGRDRGLDIFAAAVDGEPTAPAIADNQWAALPWNVGTPTGTPLAISQTGGWSTRDLLTCNNVKHTGVEETTNAYKFSEHETGKLLEFTHAMTKVTVNLTAGEGFPRTTAADPATAYFQAAPTVTLLDFNYTGSVNVEEKSSTPTAATTNIQSRLTTGGANSHTASYDALVFPGNQFPDATDILKIEADGNTYYVNATKINAANTEASNTFEQGKNYVFNIIISKTDIVVTATVKDWIDVVADTETPKINVTATYGYAAEQAGSTAFTSNYDLFRSTTQAAGYDDDNTADGINPAARHTSSSWDKTIYWPDHQTHYFFRGVYPQVGTAASGASALAAEAVTNVGGNDVIVVANAAYTAATYPSDLAIAIPRGTTDGSYDETCKVHTTTPTEGICATEGVINLNFEYAMSKVELRLKSSATGDGHIAMTKDNTKVEIIGGYSKARIKLSDGLHDTYTDADKGDYGLSNLDTPESGFLVTSRDAIVPQEIGDDVKFRITVTTDDNGTPTDPSDDKTDVYECKVKTIKETSTSSAITEWQHGKHYIYVLDINKTAINTTATITDWVKVTASDTVWF